MIDNYLKIAIRNLKNQPLNSFINIFGFAVGIASFVMIMMFVKNELSFNEFHENKERLVKLSMGKRFNTVAPLARVLKSNLPEIEKTVRISSDRAGCFKISDKGRGQYYDLVSAENILYADPSFTDVFSFRIIKGNSKQLLTKPNTIVLSEQLAQKLFSTENPLGKILEYTSKFPERKIEFTVSGIIENAPQNSSIQYEAIASYATLDLVQPNGMLPEKNWRDGLCQTYLLLKDGTNKDLFNNKIRDYIAGVEKMVYGIEPGSKRAVERTWETVQINHLHFFNNNRLRLVKIISSIGFLILFIAIINFVNLSTANFSTKAKEVCMHKIIGARRKEIMLQLIGESILTAYFASGVALFLVTLIEPLISSLAGINIPGLDSLHLTTWLLIAAGPLILGILSGIYPAVYLSVAKPAKIFKQQLLRRRKGIAVRQVLITAQFAITLLLLGSCFIINKQLNFINKKDLGYNNHNIIHFNLNGQIGNKLDVFKQRLLENPNIKSIAASQNELGQINVTLTREVKGESKYFQVLPADPDFINTYGLKLIEGRNFSYEREADKYQTLIINESALKSFGRDSIFNTSIFIFDREAKIIGVVKDFHYESFHKPVEPLALYYHPWSFGALNVAITGKNLEQTLSYIENVWNDLSPDLPFEFGFLDETYQNNYISEKRTSGIVLIFSIISICLSCLGLFGLVVFMTDHSKKEIGIRRVNGAKISELILLFNSDFIKQLMIGFIIAAPITWIIMQKWLEEFAYKTSLDWWIFILAGLVILVITLITVSWQSWRAASRNPVGALRYE